MTRSVRSSLLVLVLAVCLPACLAGEGLPADAPRALRPNQACTVVYATDGQQMLGGNNEDYFNPLTKVWFIPAEGGSFGRVYFGFDDYHAQGGMNDQGLFFDGLGLGVTVRVPTAGKQRHVGNLVDKIMSECATVECVVQTFEQYYTQDAWYWQFMFGDATGESAIVEAATILRQQGGTQVATNFLQSATPEGERTCPRYRTAVAMLEGMDGLSVEFMRDVMDAVHQNGPAHTLYTNVYDLKNKLVYLYYFHNYEDLVVLDLAQELAQGYHAYPLPSLFSPNAAAERWAEPRLEQYERLVESRRAHDVSPEILQAYAGEYGMPEGWGTPDQQLTVVAQEGSLLLRFPDYRQHELFPASATEFYRVAFQDTGFAMAYEVRFGLGERRRVQYLELVFGSDTVRVGRAGPESFVPEIATPEPTATLEPTDTARPADTPEPTATPQPTMTPTPIATLVPSDTPQPSATPEPTLAEPASAGPTLAVKVATPAVLTATPADPDKAGGFPWAWVIAAGVALVTVVAGLAGWTILSRGRRRS
jgi:hypothetical protein